MEIKNYTFRLTIMNHSGAKDRLMLLNVCHFELCAFTTISMMEKWPGAMYEHQLCNHLPQIVCKYIIYFLCVLCF